MLPKKMYSSAVAYGLQGLGLTPIFNAPSGISQDPTRYLKWFVTSNTLLGLMGGITQSQKLAEQTFPIDLGCQFWGFLASFTPDPVSRILSSFAIIHFGTVIFSMWSMYDHALLQPQLCSSSKFALKLSRIASVVSWSMFPLIWHLEKTRLISFEVAEGLFSFAGMYRYDYQWCQKS
jgi:CBS domain containing-hemolysin-like protein